jgi:hypothetical protein
METLATADQSHLFLVAENHTLISNCMILQKDGGDLSSIRLTRPLLKGSTACGLLLMAPPRSRIAGALWTILPWMTNANSAHDGFPNLYFLDRQVQTPFIAGSHGGFSLFNTAQPCCASIAELMILNATPRMNCLLKRSSVESATLSRWGEMRSWS